MAKIAFSKLNKIKSIPAKTIIIADTEVVVMQYLPLEEKLNLIQTIINLSGNGEEGFYNNDKEGCSKIPIDFCDEGNATFCWECDDGYYSNDKGECIKIPFEFCEYGNATYCEECEYKYYTNKDGGCSKIPIKYCEEGNDTYCKYCYYKYRWSFIWRFRTIFK